MRRARGETAHGIRLRCAVGLLAAAFGLAGSVPCGPSPVGEGTRLRMPGSERASAAAPAPAHAASHQEHAADGHAHGHGTGEPAVILRTSELRAPPACDCAERSDGAAQTHRLDPGIRPAVAALPTTLVSARLRSQQLAPGEAPVSLPDPVPISA
ncbi:MAG: hypothetical protein CL910_22655 [Deltaproteobacteria bacterium]|jgi:hypothetical protein|nr:hypothetical protein [Deltaproteobacteria bacterium]